VVQIPDGVEVQIPDFTFDWSCNEGMTVGEITLKGTDLADGSETVVVREVPAGTLCQATEHALPKGWSTPNASKQITVNAPSATITFTNVYTPPLAE
jgi:hypothetical protein